MSLTNILGQCFVILMALSFFPLWVLGMIWLLKEEKKPRRSGE